MGCYSGNISLDFDGTNCEKQMMEKLLQLMEPGADEEKWTLPVNKEYDFYPATALLGSLKKRDDEKCCISSGVF